jgi:uncharacterized protein
MKKTHPGYLLIFILFISSCAPAPTALPTDAIPPSSVPQQTNTAFPVTPLESVLAPRSPTAAPAEETIPAQKVTFETPDGAILSGELYGTGKTAVLFSVMGDCKPGWKELAQQTAVQGLMALTYQWRDCGPAANEDQLVRNFVNDTRGAINFVRDRGVEKIILTGVSLGGIASAKLTLEARASGLIILASPPKIPNHDFTIEASDLNVNIPKLFMASEMDSVVSARQSKKMYEIASAPKEWHMYPGTAHGTNLFNTDKGKEAQERILAFILSIAGAP